MLMGDKKQPNSIEAWKGNKSIWYSNCDECYNFHHFSASLFYLPIGWSGSGWAPRSPRASWTIWPQRKHGQRWSPGPPRRAGKRANLAHPHSCTLILSPVISSCFMHDSDTSGEIFFFTRCYVSHYIQQLTHHSCLGLIFLNNHPSKINSYDFFFIK